MPAHDGIQATRRSSQRCRTTADPGVTTFENDDYVYEALRDGASGFLLKRARPPEILHAIRIVAAQRHSAVPGGDPRVRRSATRRPATATGAPGTADRPGGAGTRPWWPGDCPTPRSPPNSWASVETVKTHVGNLLAKLRARDRTQAAIAAYESGFVPPT